MDKIAKLYFDVNAIPKPDRSKPVVFSTQDIGVAILQFNLVKDGLPYPLKNINGKIVMKMGDGTKYNDSVSVTDENQGRLQYLLTNVQIMKAGKVTGELVLTDTKGKFLFAHEFSFNIKQSLIDSVLLDENGKPIIVDGNCIFENVSFKIVNGNLMMTYDSRKRNDYSVNAKGEMEVRY